MTCNFLQSFSSEISLIRIRFYEMLHTASKLHMMPQRYHNSNFIPGTHRYQNMHWSSHSQTTTCFFTSCFQQIFFSWPSQKQGNASCLAPYPCFEYQMPLNTWTVVIEKQITFGLLRARETNTLDHDVRLLFSKKQNSRQPCRFMIKAKFQNLH